MRNEQRLGCLIGACFGLVYVLVNSGELSGGAAVPLRVAGVLAFLAVLYQLRGAEPAKAEAPDAGTRAPRMFGRGYRLVVAAEVVAGIAGLVVLRVLDASEAGVAWVSVVVGLHFVGLAAVWRQPPLRLLGLAITACGVVGLAIAAFGGGRAPIAAVGGVLPGALLLLGALSATRRVRRPASARTQRA